MTFFNKTFSRSGLAFAALLSVSACSNNQTADDAAGATLAPTQTAFDLLSPIASSPVGGQASFSRSELGRAVRQAVAAHPDVESAQSAVAIGSAQESAALGAYRPQIAIAAEASATADTNGTTSTNFGPVLRLSQLVYDGAAARFNGYAAGERTAGRRVEVVGQQAAVALSAVQIRIGVWRAEQLRSIARDDLASQNALLSQITERLDAGAGTQSDLITAQSRQATSRSQLIEANTRLENVRSDHIHIFATPAPNGAGAPPKPPSASLQTSPQLVALDFQINAASFDLNVAQAGQAPAVTLGVAARPNTNSGGLSAQLSMSLGIEYAFDTSGQRKAAVAEAEARLASLNADRASMERDLSRAIRSARGEIAASNERLTAARLLVDATQANLEGAEEQFSIGRKRLIELLDAQREYSNARSALIIAQAMDLEQRYALLGITGEILPLFDVPLTIVGEDQ